MAHEPHARASPHSEHACAAHAAGSSAATRTRHPNRAVRALESLRERSGQLRECLGGAAHPGFEPATRTLNAATLTAGRAPDERDVKAWMDANDGSWYV